MNTISSWKSFGGTLSVHEHTSLACRCPMQFAVYTPPQAANANVPVIWYLSGLTCNWSNVMEKSGLQRVASELGVMVIAPDTSPRGEAVANDDGYDLGQGAGFYINARELPWSEHYQMETYITSELNSLVLAEFPADSQHQGIMGHSMGGHGALTLHLKYPDIYRSVSAFSPIAAPTQVPWGQKAFKAYLGDDTTQWAAHDASMLVASKPTKASMLIDTGTSDQFLEEQLTPQTFIDACQQAGQALDYRLQPGYDHSYWFIASFIEDHLRHHAKHLNAPGKA